MLFLIKILSLLACLITASFYFTRRSLFYTLLHSELLIIVLVTLFLVVGNYYNSIVSLGISLCLLILGSLEIALCLLMLLL